MSFIKEFRILKKHYETILKQGLDNYPQEVGGFLGGKDGTIMGIQPLFNTHLFNKTDTFEFTQEDVIRAHEFFKKHNLDYYGLYHTHPKGIAYPSKADIDTGHKYHFILSLRNQEKPDFRAYAIQNKQPIEVPLIKISDKGFSSKEELTQGVKKEVSALKGKMPNFENQEIEKLGGMIENLRNFKSNQYEKLPPKDALGSDFSTLA